MPRRAMSVCSKPGCHELTRGGRCVKHIRPPWPHAEPSRHARGYDSAHVRLKKQVLQEEPQCRYCGDPSTTMDHILPKAQGGTSERHNVCGCCEKCQRSKAGREGNAAKRARV